MSIRYDANMAAGLCDTNLIDDKTLQITSGAGLAVLITAQDVRASSFSSGKYNNWKVWCESATARHQNVVETIALNISGPWCYPGISASGEWYFSLKDGVLV